VDTAIVSTKGGILFDAAIISIIIMKGTLFANPTFVGRGVRQPTLISVKPLVAYDEHRLFFNGISVKWQYKDIVNCTFL